MELDFNTIEEQARQLWKEQDVYRVVEDAGKPKYYVLDMFPYPSGAGLHVGHPLGYIASDIVARYKRLKGFNVLHPMGFDAFGLPAEQYAIQTGQHPAITTEKNIETYRKQLDKIGFSFDWSREVRTNDPMFYKWTQWIFLQLFKSWYNKTSDRAEPLETLVKEFEATGNTKVNAACSEVKPFSSVEWKKFSEKEQQEILMDYRVAYLAEAYVNWCPALGTVLANDEVKDGVSERGGYPVERKLMKQWMLRITAYSERLLTGLDTLDWSESMKEAQRNWIGKSEGCSIRFKAKSQKSKVDDDLSIEVFSTRPDTIFGATFIALAPEHELIEKITPPDYKTKVADYVHYAKNRSERERQTEVKKITGQFTGAYVIHPFTQQPIPVWVGEYVLAGYGTGAVMGVPGHDQRDWDFANYFKLPIISILQGVNVSEQPYEDKNGILANSDFLNGLTVSDAIKKTIDEIEKRGIGKRKVNYKQRDAVFGRQRYWGEPIPIYYKDGIPYAVEERDLPIVLPEVDKFLPTETGEPPLARAKDWKYSPPAPPQPSPKGRELSSSLDEAKGETQPKVSPLGGDLEGAGDEIPKYQTSNNKNWKYLKDFAKEHRQNPTPAEEVIWEKVRDHKLGEHIRRQHAIGNYIVDFVCLSKRLVIEIDGDIHDYKKEDDVARENYLKEVGYTVIRFKNEDVLKNTGNVIIKIKEALSAPPQPSPKGDTAPSHPSPKGKALGSSLDEAKGETQPKVSHLGGDLEGAGYPLETTTMPGWAGSSWYFLRYMDPHDDKAFASKQAMDYWKQIDLYIGGNEHATGHLLYFRFWTKFLKDRGLVSIDEPAKKLVNQGMIQGRSLYLSRYNYTEESEGAPFKIFASIDFYKENRIFEYNGKKYIEGSEEHIRIPVSYADEKDRLFKSKFELLRTEYFPDADWRALFYGNNDLEEEYVVLRPEVEKMSKSKYNVINPDEVIAKYGADCFRMYEMFLGPVEMSKPWDTKGIDGVSRFLRKFWKLFYDETAPPQPSPKGNPAPSQPSPKGKELGSSIDEPNKSAQAKVSPFGGDLEGAGDAEGKDIHPQYQKAKELLWEKILDNKLGEHIYRDYKIDNFIVDFVCLSKKVVIEIDENFNADINKDKKEIFIPRKLEKRREKKINYLKKAGYIIVLLDKEEILKDIEEAISKIKNALTAPPQPSPKGRELGDNIDEPNKSAQPKVSPFGGDLEGVGTWVVTNEKPTDAELKILYKTIKKVAADMENLSFNTSVSAFMICLNELAQLNCHKKEVLEKLLVILSPFAPHTCEYLWQKTGNKESIVKTSFPAYDEKLLLESTVTYPVAVNGKVRANVEFNIDTPNDQIEKEVMQLEQVIKWLDGKSPKKVIVVKGKMVNVVV